MTTCYTTTLTNRFHVTNPKKFKKIMRACTGRDMIRIRKDCDPNGEPVFCFGVDGYFGGLKMPHEKHSEDGFEYFITALQHVLRPDDACIIYHIGHEALHYGHEALHYIEGTATIITHDAVHYINLEDAAESKAKEILDDPAWMSL